VGRREFSIVADRLLEVAFSQFQVAFLAEKLA
jgi:hypothetical protein